MKRRRDRGEVDDASSLRWNHELRCFPAKHKCARDVGVENAPSCGSRSYNQMVHRSDAGIVDEDIEAVTGSFHFREELHDLLLVGDVEAKVRVRRRGEFAGPAAAANHAKAL